ncbi:MAG: family 43 glycosylhydrolase [Erysipelotrichaceae bacterium]|nr:family 43 glycosylhydrolase [Erysipelotrichaceae bacterium]
MNPILNLNEYIPDVEAHVFGDRVYLYGSHDVPNSVRFCVDDYKVFSSDIKDLIHWTDHGISYKKSQDPHSINGGEVDFYAPDCVKGNDGRYYLYYCAMGPNTVNFGPISVAVSSDPQGPFEYLGDVRYKDGRIVRDFLTNDPALINDEGRIYLYYGWGLGRDFRNRMLKPLYDFVLSKIGARTMKEIREGKPSVLSCAVCELQEDMLTVKEAPKAVLDSKTTADKNSELYHHPFYEAACIRKFNDLYYLIYSSGENNELAYAVSKYPDHGFEYKGVLISNADLGYKGNTIRKNNAGTIHGSVEEIDGRYYVFYHRCTNNTDYSRQVCMEEIFMDEKGDFAQVEMTSSGIEGALPGKGTYSAGICCNLMTPKMIHLGVGKQQSLPRISEKKGKLYLADLCAGCKIIYRYFDLSHTEKLKIVYEGDAELKVNGVLLDGNGETVMEKKTMRTICIEVVSGKCEIYELGFE